MRRTWIAMLFFFAATALPAQPKASLLIHLAESHSPKLEAAIRSSFSAKDLAAGKAWAGYGPNIFFATRSLSKPELLVDDHPGPEMRRIQATDLWYAVAQILPVAQLHSFVYRVHGSNFGGSFSLPVFGPLSYPQPGVREGALSSKLVNVSRIYDGMKSNYWIYAPAEYDPAHPAGLMIFQDGEIYALGYSDRQFLNAIDNLTALKKIPVIVYVFIQPGDIAGAEGSATYRFVKRYAQRAHQSLGFSMRSVEYDTVSDRYDRFLQEEILPTVYAKYNIRKDAYSRAIMGVSSGGICAFNAAWQRPEMFGRVLSIVGSFTSIQWEEDPEHPEGGQDYPDKVLRGPKRNLRVWLSDGSNDMENPAWGSWPMASIRMANALKLKGYDFHFEFGKGSHGPDLGAADFPQQMIWLWRGYNAALTSQTFHQSAAEESMPPFRVTITNRPSN